MGSTVLADGRTFGAIRLSRLTWSDIEALYAAMRAKGNGPAWVRRCATVLAVPWSWLASEGWWIPTLPRTRLGPRTVRTKPFAPTAKEVRELLGRVRPRGTGVTDAAIGPGEHRNAPG